MIEPRRSHSTLLTWSRSRLLLFLLLEAMYVTGGAVLQPATATAPSPMPLSSMTPDIDFPIFVKAIAVLCAVIFITVFSVYLNYWTTLMIPGQNQPAGGRNGLDWRCSSCSQGIGREVLDTFPILVYSTIKDHRIGKGELECVVCLSVFEDYETLRLIPKCNHVFHPECIDAWLASHVTCPVCRANLKPDSGEVAIRMPTQLNANELVGESEGRRSRSEVSRTQQLPGRQVPIDGQSSRNSSETDRANNNTDEGRSRQSRNRRSRWRMFERLPRSNSTGHSLVEQPGTNMERYTLRLPDDVRRYILLNHAAIERSVSYNVTMPMKGMGMGWSDSEGSSRGRRNYI